MQKTKDKGSVTSVNHKRPAKRKGHPAEKKTQGPPAPIQISQVKQQPTFRQLFQYHNHQAETLLVYSTLKHYYVTQRYLISYFQEKYQQDDPPLTIADYQFIAGFEQFLYQNSRDYHRPLQVNGVLKHLTRVKKMLNLAVNLDWLHKSPFSIFKMRRAEVDKPFLHKFELQQMEQSRMSSLRLQVVLDMFIFSCYTGLAYIDIFQLRKEHIVTGVDGGLWIKCKRQKTATAVTTPLLPVALKIAEEYLVYKNEDTQGYVFPRITNQKINAYLKEVALICGIKKNLTFHIARHTFATTITLSNGVPIETVSKMLGHNKLATTQVYTRVLEDKISQDMNQLRKHLANNQ